MTSQQHDPGKAIDHAFWSRKLYQYRGALITLFLAFGVVCVVLGFWLARSMDRSNVNAVREPDESYAQITCGAVVRGVSVPDYGLALPHYCLTAVSVNIGTVRIVQYPPNAGDNRTFDVATGFRSNYYNLDRVYPVNGSAYIDILTQSQ